MARKKKRRFLRFLIVLLIIILLPIALVFALFFDTKTRDIVYDESFDLNKMKDSLVVDCVEDSKTTGEVSIKFSESDINNLLYSLTQKLPENVSQFVPKVYLTIEDGNYTFTIDVQAYFFKTRVHLLTKLEDKDDNLEFTIKDVQVGRLKGLGKKGLQVLQKYVKPEDIEKTLKDNNINASIDLEKGAIIYNKKQLIRDGIAMANKSGSDQSLFFEVTNSILSNEFNYTIASGDNFGVALDLEPYKTCDGFVTPDKNLNLNLDIISNDLQTLLSSGVVDEEHVDLVWDYMVNGYDFIDTGSRTYLDSVFATKQLDKYDLSYDGLYTKSDKTIVDMMVDEINANTTFLLHDDTMCLLTESEINEFLKACGMIGSAYVLRCKDGDNYRVNYVSVDNFYCNLMDDAAIFTVGISINGYETTIVFDAKLYNEAAKELVFEATGSNIFYGNQAVSDSLIKYMFGLLYTNMNSDTIHVDREKLTISFNFEGLLNSDAISSTKKAIIDSRRDNLKLSATSGTSENSINDEGYIQLELPA